MERCGSQASRQVCDPPWRSTAARCLVVIASRGQDHCSSALHNPPRRPRNAVARKKPCEVISALRPAEPGPAAIRGAALAACRIGTVPSGWLSDRSQDTTMLSGPQSQDWSTLNAAVVNAGSRLPIAPLRGAIRKACNDQQPPAATGCPTQQRCESIARLAPVPGPHVARPNALHDAHIRPAQLPSHDSNNLDPQPLTTMWALV